MRKKKTNERTWMGLREVAAALEISHEAARRLVARGTLAHRRTRPDGCRGYGRIEVEAAAVAQLRADTGYQARTRGGTSS